jgi:tetratricopeptide (TPR) repeat protein
VQGASGGVQGARGGVRGARGVARAARWGGAALLLFAAFASKENALAWAAFLPLCALAADSSDGQPISARRALAHLGRAAAVAGPPLALFLLLRARALADMPEHDFVNWLSNPLYFTGAATRICTAIAIWGYGLWLSLCPFHLVSDYGPVTFEPIATPLSWKVALAALALLAWLAIGLRRARRAPLLFLSMSCFLGFSFLTTNIPLAVGTVFGERLYYTPSLGIAFLAAWVFGVAGRARPACALVVAVWAIACGVVIQGRNRAWHDDLTLLETDVRQNPRSVRLLDTAASIASTRGDLARAEALWKQALALEPEYADAMSNWAAALGMRGRYAEAEQLLLRALAAPAPKHQRPESTHTNLGLVYEATGRTDAAWEEFVQAFRIAPTSAGAHQPLLRLGEARLRTHRADTEPVLAAMANDARLPDNVRRRARSLLKKE